MEPYRSMCESVTRNTWLYGHHKQTFYLLLFPSPQINAHIEATWWSPTLLLSLLIQATTWGLNFYTSMAGGYWTLQYLLQEWEKWVGRSTYTNRTETPGITRPSFWLEKKTTELIAQFLSFLWRWIQCRDQRGWTTGVPEDVAHVSGISVFPLLAHEEKYRP